MAVKLDMFDGSQVRTCRNGSQVGCSTEEASAVNRGKQMYNGGSSEAFGKMNNKFIIILIICFVLLFTIVKQDSTYLAW